MRIEFLELQSVALLGVHRVLGKKKKNGGNRGTISIQGQVAFEICHGMGSLNGDKSR